MSQSKTLSPDEAALLIIQRELARRRLCDFGKYVLDWWNPAPVHELIAAALEEVFAYIDSNGQEGTGSLIIEMPPQHGKTTMVSQLFPSWLLGKRPDSRIILTSYAAELAQDSSRLVRNIITSGRYAAVFGETSVVEAPVQISDDSFSKQAWNLGEPHRGGLLATGVGGGTTGKPADLIVVDDPFKNQEEASNPVERKKKLKWMTSSVLTRTRKRTAIVMIHTRWNREDLIGEMIKSTQVDPKARPWKIISLPAFPLEAKEYAINLDEQIRSKLEGLFKPFEDPLGRVPGSRTPLWAEEFPVETLEQIKATLEATGQAGDWHALYMQQPRPEDGVFFGANDFRIIPRAPEDLHWVRYIDLAISEKKTADFNATVAEALDEEGNLYLRDMLREQGWTKFKGQLKALMLSPEERGTDWALEDVAFQALAFQELMRDKDLANVAIRETKPNGDKVTRARPLQTRAKAGKVFLIQGNWNQAFIVEALDFPNGGHDDQVDTASGGLDLLAGSNNGWTDWAKQQLKAYRREQLQALSVAIKTVEVVANA
jgi:predicted phage terminase large subunit-like protein